MSSEVVRAENGVALSGVKADVGGFKLWQSTHPDVFLFSRSQPALAKGTNGRYQVAVTTHREQVPNRGLAITGGSAIFTVTSAVQYDAEQFAQMTQAFQEGVVARGAPSKQYRYVPLNARKGQAQVMIAESSGVQVPTFNGVDVGTPGGPMSFLVDLTEMGAQEWAQGIRERTQIPAGVKYQYEYLTYVPPCGATVKLHGRRAFEHISGALDVSGKGLFYGGSAKIEAAWEKMTREGGITIEFDGAGLSPELEKIRTEITTTFANQAREAWFKTLFEPAPKETPAQAGDTKGFFGGANFAFKWKKATEVIDLEQTITFRGWTWLTTSADADITTMFAELDPSYVTEVNTEATFPWAFTAVADPAVQAITINTSFSEGRWPEVAQFGPTGGTAQYQITSKNPNDVVVSYDAQIAMGPPDWPVIRTSGTAKVGAPEESLLRTSSFVDRKTVFLYALDESGSLKLPDDADHVVLNLSFAGPHLVKPVKTAQRLTATTPVEFAYPLDPQGRPGTSSFSAFGVIGGRPVLVKEQPFDIDDAALFVLATPTGIQLVSQSTVLAEEDDVAAELRDGGARPVFGDPRSGEEAPVVATGSKGSKGGKATPAAPVVEGSDSEIVGLELSVHGNALYLQHADGRRTRLRLPVGALGETVADRAGAGNHDDTPEISVELDDEKRPDRIVVRL